ncbi:phage holin family protein [Caldibacillus lycopersici]|uniref:Phage holin family protein n=1 Tax=Perspicuibacillus lycopersici TaxID=1325689 RepID=A0AAE3LRG8_9BACI|nr:phage holin family protein [Perspicuibacillus lycopersici]MCU9614634.1 phage holin family protein [Perspicuibacillus lycopersici]
MKLNTIQMGLGAAGSFFTWFFGGWDLLLQYLLLFMVLDYITGIIKAAIKKQISNRIGFIGLARKVGVLVIVAIAHGLDRLFATSEANIFGLDIPVIRTIVIWGYIINEITSILENIKLIGVPLPAILQKILSIIKTETDNKTIKK